MLRDDAEPQRQSRRGPEMGLMAGGREPSLKYLRHNSESAALGPAPSSMNILCEQGQADARSQEGTAQRARVWHPAT